jgi:hypothetical protein
LGIGLQKFNQLGDIEPLELTAEKLMQTVYVGPVEERPATPARRIRTVPIAQFVPE